MGFKEDEQVVQYKRIWALIALRIKEGKFKTPQIEEKKNVTSR